MSDVTDVLIVILFTDNSQKKFKMAKFFLKNQAKLPIFL